MVERRLIAIQSPTLVCHECSPSEWHCTLQLLGTPCHTSDSAFKARFRHSVLVRHKSIHWKGLRSSSYCLPKLCKVQVSHLHAMALVFCLKHPFFRQDPCISLHSRCSESACTFLYSLHDALLTWKAPPVGPCTLRPQSLLLPWLQHYPIRRRHVVPRRVRSGRPKLGVSTRGRTQKTDAPLGRIGRSRTPQWR